MDEFKEAFGELLSKTLEIGDIVEWSTWNSGTKKFDNHYGVLLEIKNEIKSNRLVSISKVLPLNESQTGFAYSSKLTDEQVEKEFFTLSLRLVSKGGPDIETKED
jgi:hypothetical protein